MIDYKNQKVSPVLSFDDMALIQDHLEERDFEALAEQVALSLGIKYEPVRASDRPEAVV